MSGLAQIQQRKEDPFPGEALPAADPKIPYLYVTGTGHSGSTLLAFLLNAHPQMASISEIEPEPNMPIEKYRCSCGTLFLQCPFFSELERRMKAKGSSFSLANWQTRFSLTRFRRLNIFLLRPLGSDLLDGIRARAVPFWPKYHEKIGAIAERNVHIAGSVLAMTGKKIFVDAQKDSTRIKFLSEIEQLDLKVIHLIKDIRAGAASYMKRRSSAASAARYWYNANMSSERAKRYVSPDKWLRITYEELCSDTQRTVDRISDFVGVARAPIPEDFYATEHHIIGNRMRHKGDGAGIVKLDESWKGRLREQDLKIVAQIAGKANRYFGYDWP